MKKTDNLKRLVQSTITFLLICNISSFALGINESGDTTIIPLSLQDIAYVDDDYNESTPGWGYDHFNTIQAGVDAVHLSGTVIVYKGTYNENVIINKKITLVGSDEDQNGNTTDRPLVSDPAVGIIIIGKEASGTNVSNFDIINCNGEGILVVYSEFVELYENKITSNGRGIHLIKSAYCLIQRNVISWNIDEALYIEKSNNCTIDYNFIQYNNLSGIEVYHSGGITFSRNNLSYNGDRTVEGGYNIYLVGNFEQANFIKNNNFYDNDNYGKIRFLQSKNEWNGNYWNKGSSKHIYLIWGKNSYISFLPYILIGFQIDRAPTETPHPYICPVV
ncbi:MAG: right-handed parallel beta-helix repeat-containing protein [Candidatus Thermoplasmatota archaeon]|nr:right-handed parallel beta-helix repeat-containing protein [Candidatus Thermoplasmatota archaeon]